MLIYVIVKMRKLIILLGEIIMGETKKIFEETQINFITGEEVIKNTTCILEKEPSFVKLYIDCIFALKDVPKSLNPILLKILQKMTYAGPEERYGGQIVILNKYFKEMIAEETGRTIQRVEQAITKFIRAGILKRVFTATYLVNPELFGKGEWKNIRRIRNITAKINFKDREINPEFDIEKEKFELEDFVSETGTEE